MLANDLITYLTDAGFSVFPDPNFIPAELPESKLPCLFIFGTGGYAPHEYVPTERLTFQIIVKGKSYKALPENMAAAESLAKQLIRLLHRRSNYMAGNTHVYSSTAAQSSPIPLGLDDQDRPMYSTNFVFYVKEEQQP
ncbi:minor capsid protein [Paenibacillus sp. FSL W8-0919]|uniref:minor capsid protein n=1 Tax=Paenibacillus sp. FSL W8-0919 TaxID=2954707 RepID=UPI0030FB538E